ncbi:UNVERIFIED_CONTAM: hypothetical protein GTU68_057259 [Idotea baltica]|nr:hypothetical protein [Idotea baltica]
MLLISVFVIATCGLVYELVAGTLASYLLGDSVTQFSIIIGVYLFSMGVGSFLSKYIRKNLIPTFIRIELLIGLVGGFSAALLFILFESIGAFQFLLYGLVSLTGLLVGLEIPILMRILKDQFDFKDLVSNIFTFDYIGALLASLLFPLLLVPKLGLIRTSLLFGIFNVLVAIVAIYVFDQEIRRKTQLRLTAVVSLVLLVVGMVMAGDILSFSEKVSYQNNIVYAKSSPYQRVVLTRKGPQLRLFLNGNLQFDSRDEYRYHEALVHPGLAAQNNPENILVLGGGDGLAVREILRYPSIKHIDLVDLDPLVTQIFKERNSLTQLNRDALNQPNVTVHNADAFTWLRSNEKVYDFVVVDFPDPVNFSVGKLYTLRFYNELKKAIAPTGGMVVQSTSPYVAPKSFWCVEQTLRETGLRTVPYHCYVPSFGEWGFILAHPHSWLPPTSYPDSLQFVDDMTVRQMVHFPTDMVARNLETNRLNNQALVGYFDQEWSKYE